MFHFLKVICPNFVQTGIPPEVYDEINKIRNNLNALATIDPVPSVGELPWFYN